MSDNSEMPFMHAANCICHFRKFKGKTLNEIALLGDEGLRYINWMNGQDWIAGRLKEAVAVFCMDEIIGRQIEKAVAAIKRTE